ncbi:MAG: hypothetical protein JWR73_2522 [Tardiphaga sp.]|nr:hypothetical protein [Tardiphaga sp.]
MRCRQRPRIILRLPFRVEHQHIPGAVGAAFAAGRVRKQKISLSRRFFLSAAIATLLRLEDKTVFLVEIDAAQRVAIIVMAGHEPLEHVIVALMGRAGRLWARHLDHVAKLAQEQRVVGPLLPTLAMLPSRQKTIDPRGNISLLI